MGHNYYKEDYEEGNLQRLQYFDRQFLSLAESIAKKNGITLAQYLSNLTNFNQFKAMLNQVFSQDISLSNYVEGMGDYDKKLFFNRPIIQRILDANTGTRQEKLQVISPPQVVRQIQKKTFSYFRAKFKEYSTGIMRRTIAKKDTVTIKGKSQIVFRDKKGRFVSIK